jgi:transcriptional regulator with XRE-family HTH domain
MGAIMQSSGADDDRRRVRPDGLSVRARRHALGWSQRDLVEAIATAHERATGLRETVTPALLAAVEERGAAIPYTTLCLIAAGLDCNPVELLAPEEDEIGPSGTG